MPTRTLAAQLSEASIFYGKKMSFCATRVSKHLLRRGLWDTCRGRERVVHAELPKGVLP